MTRRMLVALLALIGLFVSLYLTLYKLGVIGTITCAVGACETVQTSRWATFLGLPVAAWGLAFYATMLALALAWLSERFEASPALALALLVAGLWGALFSAWLTYLELFVIRAICQWCVVSAVLATAMAGVIVAEYRGVGRGA